MFKKWRQRFSEPPHSPVTGEVQTRYLSERGYEVLSPTPLEPPIGYQRTPSLADQIRAMVRSERLRQEAEQAGLESFEEAEDFDVGDDFDPSSPYEEQFEPPANLQDQGDQAPQSASRQDPAPTAPAGEAGAVGDLDVPPKK